MGYKIKYVIFRTPIRRLLTSVSGNFPPVHVPVVVFGNDVCLGSYFVPCVPHVSLFGQTTAHDEPYYQSRFDHGRHEVNLFTAHQPFVQQLRRFVVEIVVALKKTKPNQYRSELSTRSGRSFQTIITIIIIIIIYL